MLDSMWLRLALALLTAIWSPGHVLCCCRVEAAPAGWDDGCVEEALTPAHPCCAVQADPVAPCGPACDRGPGPGDGRPDHHCGCFAGPVDAPLPAVSVLPAPGKHGLDMLDLLCVAPPALAAGGSPPLRPESCRGSPDRAPAATLLSLGCLLIV